jgi:hypothetical protein
MRVSEESRPFVVDRNISHFFWYGVVAGEGLRSVGEEAFPSSKSVCSILPLARRLSGRGFRAPAFIMLVLLAASFFTHYHPTRPSLRALSALRGTSGGATMTSPGGAGTSREHT